MAGHTVHQLERRPDLDGLRGVAIIFTVVFHYMVSGGFYSHQGPEPVLLFLGSLWSGVDIFFVLSGFLIGGIILDNGRADNFFRIFYLRRALRILPVAFLAIAFSYLIVPLLNLTFLWYAQTPAYAYVLLINNFWTANGLNAYAPLGPMWSLAIEEQFYLLAPVLILAAGTRTRSLGLLTIVLISPLLRLCSLHYSPWDFTPFRLDGFAAGMLVATLLRNRSFNAFAVASRRTVNLAVSGLTVAALLFSISPHYSPRERLAFGISLNSLATAAVILFLYLNRNCSLSRILSRSWLVAMGRMSYFIYLMHLPILMCVATLSIPIPLQPPIAFGLCLLYAWGSWRWPESSLIGLGRRFSYHHPRFGSGYTGAPATAAISGNPPADLIRRMTKLEFMSFTPGIRRKRSSTNSE
jgi:peptidoglycan/LPS O-acetylase OafA/YrhL